MDRKVLIVEDEVLVGMMLARKLESAGYVVVDIVGSGEEAVAAAKRYRPGVMLLDISLSGELDGIDVAGRIKAFHDIPAIFFTGYYLDSQLMARAAQVQALAVLDKLGPVEELLAALEQAFS